jgi:hypothetical protein
MLSISIKHFYNIKWMDSLQIRFSQGGPAAAINLHCSNGFVVMPNKEGIMKFQS